ncbi:putative membrane protein [Clostridioides difficile F314]|nr:putative membrane protein [Clostridioides difficile F314]
MIEVLSSSEHSLFVKDNVKRFRIIGYLLLLNSIMEFISTFGTTGKGMRFLDLGFGFYFTVPVFVYFITSLMSFVIADGFVKAIKIKEDNDLTI